MRLHSLTVENFRTHREPLCLDGLGPGLTVVSGDNEAGKSTVLTALRAAFFLRHDTGGEARKSLLPYGAAGSPRVEVEFSRGGERHKLCKRFEKNGVTLETPAGTLTGEAAEALLASLLGFERAATVRYDKDSGTIVKPEHTGLHGLFWVEQGRTFAGFKPEGDPGRRLSAFVEGEVGAITGGQDAAELIKAALEGKLRFFTPTGREREGGPLKLAMAEHEAAETLASELEGKRRAFEDRLEALAAARGQLRRTIEADEAGRAQARVKELEAELVAAERLDGQRQLAAQTLDAVTARLQRLERLAQERERARHQLATLESEFARALERQPGVEAEAERARTALAASRKERQAANEELAAARGQASGLRASIERAASAEKLERLREDLAAMDAALDRARLLKAEAEAIRVDERALEELRRLSEFAGNARAALEAVATTLEIDLAAGAALTKDGEPVEGRSLTLTEPATLRLGENTIRVTPGGGDLANRRRQAERARAELADALSVAGVATLQEAAAAQRKRQGLLSEAREAQSAAKARLELHRLAKPEELRAAVARARAVLESAAVEGAPDVPDPRAALERAEAEEREAGERLRRAEVQAQAEEAALETAREAAGSARVERGGLELRLAEAKAEALRLDAEAPAEQLAADLEAAARERGEARSRLDAVQERLERAEPGDVRGLLDIQRRKAEQARRERQDLERRVDQLGVEVRTLGADGLDEKLAEAHGRLERASAKLARAQREAAAWKLLHDKLEAAQARRREAVTGPVLEKIKPYVRGLFGEAEPVFDGDTLQLTGLKRGGEEEAFNQLSVGAREQLSILVRLAFADLAAGKGLESPCLVLDDALVYADEGRLERMQAVLQRAAERHQVLLLTCRKRDYLGLNADFRDLNDCR